MRMYTQDNIISVLEMFIHPLDLVCVNLRCCHFNRCRQIEDDLIVIRVIPCLLYRVADIQCEFHFCSGKALRRIFQCDIALTVFHPLFYHIGSIDRDLLDRLFVHMKHHITLKH